jgi:hypothetical protein
VSDLNIGPVKTNEFSATAALADGNLSVQLVGNADLRNKEALDVFLRAVHAEALRRPAGEVSVDVRQLQFMNSSCFKNFVSWLCAMQDCPPEAQYRIRFLSNATMHWQKRSMHALSCFAADLVTVQF